MSSNTVEAASIHANAMVEAGAIIGSGTSVQAFAHVLSGAKIGDDCNICDHVFVPSGAVIGQRVTVNSGARLHVGVRLDDDVVVDANVTFAHSSLSPNEQASFAPRETFVQSRARIGANSTILESVSIGRGATVGAGSTIGPDVLVGQHARIEPGSVVGRNIPPFAIVSGNPATIVGYVDARSSDVDKPLAAAALRATPNAGIRNVGVGRAAICSLPIINDIRGTLSAAEYGNQLPFVPKRYFVVFDVPGPEVRGEHAHKTLEQFLVVLMGQVSVVLDDGATRVELLLDSPSSGLYIPPLIWGIQYKYSKDAMLLVLASESYDPDDYIRDYDEFLRFIGKV